VRIALLAAALALIATPTLAAELTATQLTRQLQAEGPKATVQQLWNSGAYDSVLNHVASGDPAWIALAARLASGADAAASESLTIALAEALPKNPGAVLAILGPAVTALSPARVCGAPFIEMAAPDLRNYLSQTRTSVSAVSTPALGSSRAACLAALPLD